MKSIIKRFNRTAILSITIAFGSIIVGLSINVVVAVSWQDPNTAPPNLGSLEPPLNTSIYDQEKIGGFTIASEEGGLSVGTSTIGAEKIHVLGSSYINGDFENLGTVTATGNITANSINAGNSSILNDLNVNNGLLRVDSATDYVFIDSAVPYAKLTVETEDQIAMDIETDTASAIFGMYAFNVSGPGIAGVGSDYGVLGRSVGYGVVADAELNGQSALYAKGRDIAKGLIGIGKYGIVGLDNTEDIKNPIYSTPSNTVAGLFEGSVDIIPSAGGNSDLAVDTDNFVVRSLNNKIGIGTSDPVTRLNVVGDQDASSIYVKAETNTNVGDDDGHQGPGLTVSGFYTESGTVTYGGSADGWNFGIFGKAGDPGSGRTVGIMGVDYSSGGDTYAGWFDGDVNIEGSASVVTKLKTYNSAGTITAQSDINGLSDLNLTGDMFADGGVENLGKLVTTGGLPAVGSSIVGSCNVAPGEYAEGTMYVCDYCITAFGQRYHVQYARMNHKWVVIGYTKGKLCGYDQYEPEIFNPIF